MVGVRGNDRLGKSGGLHFIQSAFRAHLAGIQETSSGLRFPEIGQYSAQEPVCFKAVSLGEEAPHGWKEAHLNGGPPKTVGRLLTAEERPVDPDDTTTQEQAADLNSTYDSRTRL